MPQIKTVLAAVALLWAVTGQAQATPVVIDPNFNETPTSADKYYGMERGRSAWRQPVLRRQRRLRRLQPME